MIFTGRLFLVYEWKNIKSTLDQIQNDIVSAWKYVLQRFRALRNRSTDLKLENKISDTGRRRSSYSKTVRKTPFEDWIQKKKLYEKEITNLKEDNVLIKLALKERQEQTMNLESLLRKRDVMIKLMRKENEILKALLRSNFFNRE